MNGGEGIVCVAKSSWKKCISIQGKAEGAEFAVDLAYCFIVGKVVDIEPIVVVIYRSIIGHWDEQKQLLWILVFARFGVT